MIIDLLVVFYFIGGFIGGGITIGYYSELDGDIYYKPLWMVITHGVVCMLLSWLSVGYFLGKIWYKVE